MSDSIKGLNFFCQVGDIPSLSICMCVCFFYALSISYYIASNVFMTGELEGFLRKFLWSNQYTILAFAWGD
jgi:hypothetical protein